MLNNGMNAKIKTFFYGDKHPVKIIWKQKNR